jgi:hypothetical protein
MKYVPPGLPGSIVPVAPRYENFIGGKWLAPTEGRYRADVTPISGIGGENDAMMLDQASPTKNLLVSHSSTPPGLF